MIPTLILVLLYENRMQWNIQNTVEVWLYSTGIGWNARPGLKGIVSRDGLSTETIGFCLNIPPRICLTPRKSRVKHL
jgi:hypothetical protein